MRLLSVLAFLCVFLSCEDEIFFETQNREILIIDGSITNGEGPHIVKLSKTAKFGGDFEDRDEKGVSGATVRIEDDLGEFTRLVELDSGSYHTPDIFRGEIGRTYVLCITTLEGLHYQSEPETLPNPGELGDVYFEITTEQVLSSLNFLVDETRVNFYTDFSFPDKGSFYRWDWDGTYILETTFLGSQASQCGPQTKFPKPAPLKCYVDQVPGDGFIRLSESNNSSSLEKNRFLIVSSIVDFSWDVRYSMHLSRLSMTESSYKFWDQALAQKERSGSIFDPAPSTIVGNISNINDEEEVVLGNFAAYGVQNARLFVPGFNFSYSSNTCLTPRDGGPPSAYCCDCRFFEPSTAEKPDFWIDG